MRKILLSTVVFGMASVGLMSGASAYPVNFYTGNTNGNQFNAALDGTFEAATGNTFIGASFNYTGPLNFVVGPPQNGTNTGDKNSVFFANGSISNYTVITATNTLGSPAGANFSTQANFLVSSGSAANFQYGSLMAIGIGSLAAGTVLTIDHDDGASVYQLTSGGPVRIGTTTAGPTSEITETVRLTNGGETYIVYGRENGAPSILNVAVPEPMSIASLGAGLVGLGLVRRKKRVS